MRFLSLLARTFFWCASDRVSAASHTKVGGVLESWKELAKQCVRTIFLKPGPTLLRSAHGRGSNSNTTAAGGTAAAAVAEAAVAVAAATAARRSPVLHVFHKVRCANKALSLQRMMINRIATLLRLLFALQDAAARRKGARRQRATMHQRPDSSNSDNNNNSSSTSSGAQQADLVSGQSQATDICSRLEAMDVVRNME